MNLTEALDRDNTITQANNGNKGTREDRDSKIRLLNESLDFSFRPKNNSIPERVPSSSKHANANTHEQVKKQDSSTSATNETAALAEGIAQVTAMATTVGSPTSSPKSTKFGCNGNLGNQSQTTASCINIDIASKNAKKIIKSPSIKMSLGGLEQEFGYFNYQPTDCEKIALRFVRLVKFKGLGWIH